MGYPFIDLTDNCMRILLLRYEFELKYDIRSMFKQNQTGCILNFYSPRFVAIAKLSNPVFPNNLSIVEGRIVAYIHFSQGF